MKRIRPIFRAVGSLWFAAVLLMLLLVVLAGATVYESIHGTAPALETFYRSVWFKVLLGLIGVNVTAAVLLRYPFSKRQIGFVITHAAIVLTLVGALVTEQVGVEGQVGITEGQTVDRFNHRLEDALSVVNRLDKSQASIDLTSKALRGFRAVEQPRAPRLELGDAQISVERYLPDTAWSRHVSETDDASLGPAVEVSLPTSGRDNPTWVFADHRPVRFGHTSVSFRAVSDPTELAGLLSEQTTSPSDSVDVVRVTCQGEVFEIPLDECRNAAAPVGDTGYTIRVLRYLPHATVGPDRRLTSASDQPINPAIEVEIAGPSTKETRIAFARFPGFRHGENEIEDVELTFVTGGKPEPEAPVEIIGGPAGEMYVRFQGIGSAAAPRPFQVGTPVDTPWTGRKLTVLRRFEHARVDWTLESVDPIRPEREPGLLLKIRTPESTSEMWVQKHETRSVLIDDVPHALTYTARQVPLGFLLTLNSFQIGTYPGSNRPRSFESQVTTVNPVTGRTQNHVISMNHPAEVGGYTLYQSSYSESRDGPSISYLSVSRDPGQPIAFAGYIGMMAGMLVVLCTRIAERRGKLAPARGATEQARAAIPAAIPAVAARSYDEESGPLTGRRSVGGGGSGS
jgi:hypothetical protein